MKESGEPFGQKDSLFDLTTNLIEVTKWLVERDGKADLKYLNAQVKENPEFLDKLVKEKDAWYDEQERKRQEENAQIQASREQR